MDMLKEADPDSLALLEDQLRSPDLTPHSSLGEISHEGLRQDIVAEVILRRSRLLSSSNHPAEDQPGRLLIYVPGLAENPAVVAMMELDAVA